MTTPARRELLLSKFAVGHRDCIYSHPNKGSIFREPPTRSPLLLLPDLSFGPLLTWASKEEDLRAADVEAVEFYIRRVPTRVGRGRTKSVFVVLANPDSATDHDYTYLCQWAKEWLELET
jgi:hypothetical protein